MDEFICETQPGNDRFTLTYHNGFNIARRSVRKSLGTIPFRKLDVAKAGMTQQVATSRRDSTFKIVKRGKSKRD